MSIAADPLSAGPSLAIVGNAPSHTDAADAIDAAETVLRFNNAAGFGGPMGRRVTHLALVNRGGQAREWVEDAQFLERPAIQAAGSFVLPFPMLPTAHNVPEPICWTRDLVARLTPLGRPIHILPDSLHDHARHLLAPLVEDRPNPSTGFLVTLALLTGRQPGSPPAAAYGFGFDGWPGHPWEAERAWFTEAEARGLLRLHPPRREG